MKHIKPSKMTVSGGLVRTTNGKRVASIELDLYKVVGMAFTEKNPNWQVQEGYNAAFLRAVLNHLQTVLSARGHLFLNEALCEFGFEKEPAGQVLGWHREDGPLSISITFRNDQHWVEFNVHGVIVNRI